MIYVPFFEMIEILLFTNKIKLTYDEKALKKSLIFFPSVVQVQDRVKTIWNFFFELCSLLRKHKFQINKFFIKKYLNPFLRTRKQEKILEIMEILEILEILEFFKDQLCFQSNHKKGPHQFSTFFNLHSFLPVFTQNTVKFLSPWIW